MKLTELLTVLAPRAEVQLVDDCGNALTNCTVLAKSIQVSALPRALSMKQSKVLRVSSCQYPEEMGTHIEVMIDFTEE